MKSNSKMFTLLFIVLIGLFAVNADADQSTPILDIWVEPNPLMAAGCTNYDTVVLYLENNSQSEITVDWTSQMILTDPHCVTLWSPGGGRRHVYVGELEVIIIEFEFSTDCKGKSQILFQAEIVDNPADFDDEAVTVYCGPNPFPTLSQWGLIILMIMIMLTGIAIWVVLKRERIVRP